MEDCIKLSCEVLVLSLGHKTVTRSALDNESESNISNTKLNSEIMCHSRLWYAVYVPAHKQNFHFRWEFLKKRPNSVIAYFLEKTENRYR